MTTFNEYKAKEEIAEVFDMVSFRKFGNAFRKNINENFKAEYNTTDVGGRVSSTFLWSDYAAYIIGDGSYSLTEEQFNSFMQEFKK